MPKRKYQVDFKQRESLRRCRRKCKRGVYRINEKGLAERIL